MQVLCAGEHFHLTDMGSSCCDTDGKQTKGKENDSDLNEIFCVNFFFFGLTKSIIKENKESD